MQQAQIIAEYRSAFLKKKEGVIDMDEQLSMRCVYQLYRLEKLLEQFNHDVPPFRQSDYYIKLMRTAEGTMTVGHFQFPLADHMLTIVPPRVIQSSKYEKPTSTGYLLTFNLDFFLQNGFPREHIVDKKVLKRSVRPYTVLTERQETALVNLFESIEREQEGGNPAKEEMIAVKIIEILILCERCFHEREDAGEQVMYDELLERFDALLEENYVAQRGVRFYASSLNVHPNHLNHVSKSVTGLSAKQTISNRVLLEAKYMLASSSLSIKEIAYALGFDDPNYFVSFFKTHVNRSPSEYRLQPV